MCIPVRAPWSCSCSCRSWCKRRTGSTGLVRWIPLTFSISWLEIRQTISYGSFEQKYLCSVLSQHHHHHLIFWKRHFLPNKLGSDVCPRIDIPYLWQNFTRFNSTTSGKYAIIQLSAHGTYFKIIYSLWSRDAPEWAYVALMLHQCTPCLTQVSLQPA